MAETCFCRTGLNHGLNHLWQKLANPGLAELTVCCFMLFQASSHVVRIRASMDHGASIQHPAVLTASKLYKMSLTSYINNCIGLVKRLCFNPSV